MKKLNKVCVFFVLIIATMLLLSVKTSAAVDASVVSDTAKAITFDADYYLDAYADLKAAYGSDAAKAYEHFLVYGISEGRCANLKFDVTYYVENYADLKQAYGTNYEEAYYHFIVYGLNEGRSGCLVYDSSYYMNNNADLKATYGTDYALLYLHYAVYGVKEGRQGSEDFNVKCYLRKYSDLTEAFTATGYEEGFKHYLIFGVNEGRIGVHEYTVATETVEATCVDDGYTVYACACGLDSITTVIEATGIHTEVVDEAVEATCTETGLTEGSHCSVCGLVLVAQEEIPATGHTEVIDEAVEATCTETGLTEGSHCSVCGLVLVAQEEVPATGHSYVASEDEIVFAEDGTTATIEYTCSLCGDVQTVEAEVVSDEENSVVADCETETNGKNVYVATVSEEDSLDGVAYTATYEVEVAWAHDFTSYVAQLNGSSTYDTQHYAVCGVCGYKELQSHNFEEQEGEDPTCEDDGYYINYCADCDTKIYVTIPATEHDMTKHDAVEATCEEDGNREYYTCSNDCCEGLYFAGEQGGATLDWDSDIVISATGHSYKKVKKVDPVCGGTTTDSEGNEVEVEPTDGMEEHYVCTKCGKLYTYEDGVFTETTEEALTIDAYAYHDLDSEFCTYEKQETSTEPNCKTQTDGLYVYKCSVCKDVIEVTMPWKESHSYTTLEVTKEATCTETGTETVKCSICETTGESTIPATGHDMKPIEAVEATCTTLGNNAYYYCNNCQKYFKDEAGTEETTVEAEVVEALGHDYELSEFYWVIDEEQYKTLAEYVATLTEGTVISTSDVTACAKYVCANDEEHIYEPAVLVTVSDGDEYDPCITNETKILTATIVAEDETLDNEEAIVLGEEEVVTEEKVGHEMGELVEELPATCTEDGHKAYYHCSECDTYFADKKGDTVIGSLTNTVLTATGHKYSVTNVEWATDYSTCTITYTCANDVCANNETTNASLHVKTVTVNSTKEVTTEGDCTTDEVTTYTATVTEALAPDEVEYVKTIDVVTTPAPDHTWLSDGDKGYDDAMKKYGYSNTPATCSSTGIEYTVCSECGEVTMTITDKNPDNHSYGKVVKSETYEGYYEEVCELCGDTVYYTTAGAEKEVKFLEASDADSYKTAVTTATENTETTVTYVVVLTANIDLTEDVEDDDVTIISNGYTITVTKTK